MYIYIYIYICIYIYIYIYKERKKERLKDTPETAFMSCSPSKILSNHATNQGELFFNKVVLSK